MYKDAAGGIWEMDLLDRLLENAYSAEDSEGAGSRFNEEELRDEMFAFFLAGNITTTDVLTFIVFFFFSVINFTGY
jgi:cytochrome P450